MRKKNTKDLDERLQQILNGDYDNESVFERA